MERARGFTLFEVLIALAIFALCAAVLLEQSNRSLRQQQALEARTFARWIAENHLTELQLRGEWLAVGSHDESLDMAAQSWEIETLVAATADPDLERVDIAVSNSAAAEVVLNRLTGFIGRF
ncbi:MAG: type II secretion system minor pseudopilin GspI [Porticoccaceae bacterium]